LRADQQEPLALHARQLSVRSNKPYTDFVTKIRAIYRLLIRFLLSKRLILTRYFLQVQRRDASA